MFQKQWINSYVLIAGLATFLALPITADADRAADGHPAGAPGTMGHAPCDATGTSPGMPPCPAPGTMGHAPTGGHDGMAPPMGAPGTMGHAPTGGHDGMAPPAKEGGEALPIDDPRCIVEPKARDYRCPGFVGP